VRIARRSPLPLVALAAFFACGAALAGASSTVTVRSVKSGPLGGASILVNQGGKTLYHYTDDRGKKIDCKASCATAWPPLLLAKGAKLKAGPGVTKGKLATVMRPDGKLQVTYAGMTLYRYAADAKAGELNGQGIGRKWFVVSVGGKLVKAAPQADGGPPSPPPPPPPGYDPYP
jgi:predicted lipoprotein with Yx(FWY)xxD motif